MFLDEWTKTLFYILPTCKHKNGLVDMLHECT